MVPPRKEGMEKEERTEGSDRLDQRMDGESAEDSTELDESRQAGPSDAPQLRRRIASGLTERIRDVLGGESEGDLVLEPRDVEDGVLQWIRALDLQVLGACRADERLKPLLKLKVSSGLAEDRLLAQLSQHFEVSEVGLLARCLCVPLVSIRVGKVHRQGKLLCPTATRGHLNLNLLPSSDMRISFSGDDGFTERLAVVSNDDSLSDLIIEEIPADTSGRSFVLKLPESQDLYYWCAEKSKLHGRELLVKMSDLLRRKPSLSDLTGISQSRLDSFATHLRSYLLGSSNTAEANLSASSYGLPFNSAELGSHSSSMVSKSSRFRLTAAHTAKVHSLYQGSLIPRLNTFKDGMPRTSSSTRSGAREKLRLRGDNRFSLSTINSLLIPSVPATCITNSVNSGQIEDGNSRSSGLCGSLPCYLPPSLSAPLSSNNLLSPQLPQSEVRALTQMFSPYYCWCPPCPSALQYTITPSHLPSASSEPLPLPPLSSLLSSAGPPASLVPSKLSVDVAELPSFNHPAIFPEPLVRFPHPVSTQQIPTFIPFMSDPIVHIPVLDVCSSGQGYLVSAGPAISSAIPPLLPSLVKPLIPATESVIEKNARETLRMLMAAEPTPPSPQLINMLPAVLNSAKEKFRCTNVNKHDAVTAAGLCLSSGTLDVNSVSLSFMGLSSFGEMITDDDTAKSVDHGGNIGGDKADDLQKSS